MNLRNGGMSLQKIRIALKALQKILDTGVSFSDVTVVSDGQSIYASKNENDFIDILRKGQAVFGISLGPVHDEIEQQVINLWPSKDRLQDGK